MRWMTTLTNGFSKKMEDQAHAVACIHALQLARVHQTLRVLPAMEAGVADHVWSIDEIVELLPELRDY